MRMLAALMFVLFAAGCETTLPREPGSPRRAATQVTGRVVYEDTAALPRPGELRVVLRQDADGDAPEAEIAAVTIDIVHGVNPPFAFALDYDRGRIDRRRAYSVHAELRDAGGDLRFASASGAAVITHRAPRRDVEIVLVPAPPPEADLGRESLTAAAAPAQAPAPPPPAPPTPPAPALLTPPAAPPVAPAPTPVRLTAPAPRPAQQAARSTPVATPPPAAPAVTAAPPPPPPAPEPAAAPVTTTRTTAQGRRSRAQLRADRIDFRAVGADWILDLYPERIDLSFENGAQRMETALPVPIQPAWRGLIYQTRMGDRLLIITIRAAQCRLSESGETYPARVTVEVEGRVLEGCGRAV